VCDADWPNQTLEQAIFSNAVWGMCTSILFAWIVLLIATKNFIISLHAVFTLSLVITTIMASIKLQGWALGVAESIGLIIFTGLSVDYVVHMCHSYSEAVFESRKKKTDSCFENIGTTIINGAVTSFAAGCFLYFCQMTLLHKFGVMMMVTIASAFLYSMMVYPALCYKWGPEGKQGDFYYTIVRPIIGDIDEQDQDAVPQSSNFLIKKLSP